MVVSVGEKAPDFTLLDSDSNEFKFSDLDGGMEGHFLLCKRRLANLQKRVS